MNELQAKNIRESLKDWAVQCIRRKAFPVFFVAMQDDKGALVWTGARYTNHQVKKMMQWLAEETPDDHEQFKGVGIN